MGSTHSTARYVSTKHQDISNINPKEKRDKVDANTYREMLNVLRNLLNHTHSTTLVSTVTADTSDIKNETKRKKVSAETFREMLNVLKSLLNHKHNRWDNYGTACNCNCPKTGRGFL